MFQTDAFDRPIAFHRVFRRITGSLTAALFLSQAWYWSTRTGREPEADGLHWFYKTQKEWEEETTLSEKEQKTARKVLVELGFIREERRGLSPKLWFALDHEKIMAAVFGNTCSPVAGSPDLPSREQVISQGGNLYTESTAETTQETTSLAETPKVAQEKSRDDVNDPYKCFAALCFAFGDDPTERDNDKRFLGRQLSIAKRILDSGYTPDQVYFCIQWLKPQTWHDGTFDLALVETQMPKWAMAGKPRPKQERDGHMKGWVG